jgi:hypothetical protein
MYLTSNLSSLTTKQNNDYNKLVSDISTLTNEKNQNVSASQTQITTNYNNLITIYIY